MKHGIISIRGLAHWNLLELVAVPEVVVAAFPLILFLSEKIGLSFVL